MNKQWYVLLACQHTITMPPHREPKGLEMMFCPRCRNANAVIGAVFGPGYRFRCQQCPYARAFGVSELQRTNAAISHARAKSHAVNLFYNDLKERVIDFTMAVPDLFSDDRVPF